MSEKSQASHAMAAWPSVMAPTAHAETKCSLSSSNMHSHMKYLQTPPKTTWLNSVIGPELLANKLHWQTQQNLNPVPFRRKLIGSTHRQTSQKHSLCDHKLINFCVPLNYILIATWQQTLAKTSVFCFYVKCTPHLLSSTGYLLCSAYVCRNNTMQNIHILILKPSLPNSDNYLSHHNWISEYRIGICFHTMHTRYG